VKVTGSCGVRWYTDGSPWAWGACGGWHGWSKYTWSQCDTAHRPHTWFHHAAHCWMPSRTA